jgi:type VI secretion system FHA domain protein
MIVIRLVSQADAASVAPREAVFGEAGGDIGRSADCTLVLPDPERRISRKHLQIACRDGRYFLRLISTNLGVELDGVPLAPGAECLLNPGAQIRIGPFVLRVRGESALGRRRAVDPVTVPAAVAADPAADEALMPLGQSRATSKPSVFHDLLHAPQVDPGAATHLAQAGAAQAIDLVVGDPSEADQRQVPRRASTATEVPVGGLAARAAAADLLVEAVYAGLGIPAPAPASCTPAQMTLIGELLRAAMGGTLGLLAARGIAKRELGANQTLIQMRNNNPLKFSADLNAALTQLLEPPKPGYTPSLTAVHDAFDDLRAHDVAVLAGMRAALELVLARFKPETLEAGLLDKGMWDNLRPINHKAKLWERYGEQHAEIVREIEEDFDSFFADAFIAAYEAQLAQLNRPS